MAIGKATCPTCNSIFQVDSSMVGQYVRCPWCGEEIYMEGVDAPQEVPVGILHPRPSPTPAAVAEKPPADRPPDSPEPSGEYVAEDEEPPPDESDGAAKFMTPGLYALFVLMVLLCAFLGYRTAVKRHRQPFAAPQGSTAQVTVQPLPSDGYAAEEDIFSAAELNDEDAEAVDTPIADTDTVVDESEPAEPAGTVAENAEPGEVDPFESIVAEAEREAQDAGEEAPNDEPSGPFVLDAAPLAESYRNSGISIFKCRMALKDFDKAVSAANAVAETNRANMVKVVVKYLKSGMAKAQAAGDLDKVIAFKKALETADAGIDGDLEEIAKLRASRDAQKAKIDNALLAAGTTAARGLHGALDWQKRETTRKNEIEQAQKIAAFQKQIEEWMTKTKESAAGGRSSSRATTQQKVRRPAEPVRQPVREPPRDATAWDSRPSAGGFSNQTLTGTQTEESITLAKTSQPHVIKEQYVVPQGKELIVEAGATIVFERGASLYCEGTLRMNGSEHAPIICKGKMQTIGFWSGIRLRSEDAILDWVQISGAVQAIQLNKNPSILNCAIFKNEKCGIHIGMDCAGGDARIVNCVIADNGEKGIDCHHGRASFEKCTITRNGKYGMWVGYSGHVQMNGCKIEGNKSDGFCFDAGGQGDVRNSSITGNKGFDIKYTGGGASNFRECYWGQSITRMLQQRGDGANLPNIMDGRDSGNGNFADVAEFLTEPPRDCGATVRW